jgi:hypothetical protein
MAQRKRQAPPFNLNCGKEVCRASKGHCALIGYFHIDICEVQKVEGKHYLVVAIDYPFISLQFSL